MYTSKVTGKRQITIPKEVCAILEIQNGDHVDFVVQDRNILFKKADILHVCPYCHQSVNIRGNHVSDDNGQKYHLNCYVRNNKEVLD